ncbi:tetratricopeptide repeat protein [Balneolaceae bacterium ANBcel3]|nr:tetratricopeptide repeat protein [Balneolaceae bacterium ANBcel3]
MKGFVRSTILLLFFAIFPGFINYTWSQVPEKSDTQIFEQGVRLYEEGLYEHSSRYFNRYLEKEEHLPLRERAFYYLTLTEIARDSLLREAYISRFLNTYPSGLYAEQLLEDMAARSFSRSEYEKSLSYYEKAFHITHRDEKKASYLFWMAESAYKLVMPDSASTLFRKVAEAYPETDAAPKALYSRGRIYLEKEQFEKASEIFEILRDTHPHHPITRQTGTALGEMYYRQERYEEAIATLRGELAYLDGDALLKAVLLIAESHNYLQAFDQAATQYRRYINLSENEMQARPAHYGLGWIYHKQRVYHWAADAFGKASYGEDDLARRALYYKAVNRKLSGRYDLALEVFEEYGRRFPEGYWLETAYYEWALTAIELGRYDLAIEVLQHLTRNQPDLNHPGRVYSLLGEAFFANNEFSRAIQAFEVAGRTTDVDAQITRQAQFQRAWVLYQNHAYNEARQAFDAVFRDQPSDELATEALFWSADSYFQLGRYQDAIRQFERFRDSYPEHKLTGAATYSLGWAHFHLGNYRQAITYFERFDQDYDPPPIALFPYDVDTHLRLGDAHYALADYTGAIEHYSKVAGAEAGGDYAIFQMGHSYFRENMSFEAVSNFRRLIQLFPYSRLREQAKYNIGYIFFQIGNYDQAINEFHELINRYPGTSWAARAQYQIGDAFYNSGNYEEAIEAYRLILDEYPRSNLVVDAVNGIQFAQLASGMEDTSLNILENFLSQHPQTGTADQLRFRQAESLMQAGDYEEAIRSFRNYIRVTTTERRIPEAWIAIAESYERMEELEEALSAYHVVVNDFENSDRFEPALLHTGRLEFDLGRYSYAIRALELLVEQEGRLFIEGLSMLGEVYLADGRIGSADQAFDRVLENRSGYDPALVGKGRVALQRGQFMDASRYFSRVAETNMIERGAEAQYYLGIVEQRRGNHSTAIEEFARVSVLYEAYSRWVAKAMLATAESYRAMGQQGNAHQVLRNIKERFPGTSYAEEAESQL